MTEIDDCLSRYKVPRQILRRILLLSKTPEQGAKNGIGRKFIEINIAPKGYANEP